jgi:hypothetical protein
MAAAFLLDKVKRQSSGGLWEVAEGKKERDKQMCGQSPPGGLRTGNRGLS